MIIQLKNKVSSVKFSGLNHKFRELLRQSSLTLVGLTFFVLCWAMLAANLQTSLGQFPGPGAVAEQVQALVSEYQAEQKREQLFYLRQHERLAKDENAIVRMYSGRPTFFSQIQTSLQTVLSGFLLASLIAIPAGIVIGLSPVFYSAFNPLIQLLKPVSPLAWLPLITIVVSASYPVDGLLSRSYLVSALTVALCSLWPTLINTIVGVSQVPTDLQNVSKVLRLNWYRHVRAIVLPSAIPMIFTGLRLSLGIAWMVLIAAEMLAQNPGLGKFVWDEFQNGSSESLARICVAVGVIGLIGLLLDRAMLAVQRAVSWDKNTQLR
jgi:nitrate/nitrite transport system permease protein